MTEQRMARPVSGEIMSAAGASSQAAEPRRASDVVDAEFETVAASRAGAETGGARGPGSHGPGSHGPGSHGPGSHGMTILRADAAAGSRRAGPAFWLFGTVLVLGAFWVSGGHALVSRPDPAAPAAEERWGGLRIVELTSRVEKAGDGRSHVLVDGQVVNTGRDHVPLPALDIRVTDAAGRSTLYVLGTGERRLAPSARFPFSGRLEAPADGVGTVTVDFSSEVK